MHLKNKIPVVNPRYQRLRNSNKWIDHRPAQIVPGGTIFQPQTSSKCSVTKLTDPKPFMTKSARYCLYAQEQDTDGELETKLYKVSLAFERCFSGYDIFVPWEEKGPRFKLSSAFKLGWLFFFQRTDAIVRLNFQADVLPTSGGGAQVVFNDIECLKQFSPAKQK